jgi:hypothetical protein
LYIEIVQLEVDIALFIIIGLPIGGGLLCVALRALGHLFD